MNGKEYLTSLELVEETKNVILNDEVEYDIDDFDEVQLPPSTVEEVMYEEELDDNEFEDDK